MSIGTTFSSSYGGYNLQFRITNDSPNEVYYHNDKLLSPLSFPYGSTVNSSMTIDSRYSGSSWPNNYSYWGSGTPFPVFKTDANNYYMFPNLARGFAITSSGGSLFILNATTGDFVGQAYFNNWNTNPINIILNKNESYYFILNCDFEGYLTNESNYDLIPRPDTNSNLPNTYLPFWPYRYYRAQILPPHSVSAYPLGIKILDVNQVSSIQSFTCKLQSTTSSSNVFAQIYIYENNNLTTVVGSSLNKTLTSTMSVHTFIFNDLLTLDSNKQYAIVIKSNDNPYLFTYDSTNTSMGCLINNLCPMYDNTTFNSNPEGVNSYNINNELVSSYTLQLASSVTYNNITYTVVGIDDSTFQRFNSYKWGFTSVILPNNIKSIGHYAFYNCNVLTGSIMIPSSLNEIGFEAFINTNLSTFDFLGAKPNKKLLITSTSWNNVFPSNSIINGGVNNGWINNESFLNASVNSPPYPTLGELIITNHTISESTFTVSPPISNSSGTFTFSIVNGNSYASINETTGVVTILGKGTVTIRATQNKTQTYYYGIAESSFIIDDNIIKKEVYFHPWTIPSNIIYVNNLYTVIPPYSNSNGTLVYSITSGGSYATINENTGVITRLAQGTITVRITQLGNTYFNSAFTEASLTIAIVNGTTFSTNNNSTNTLNYYVLDDLNRIVSCIGGSISNGNLIIPSNVTNNVGTTYTVIEIGDNAFYGSLITFAYRDPQPNATTISRITFPNTLITLGHNAFRNQYSINGEIIFPAGFQYIGANAFSREINEVPSGYFNASITSTKFLGNKPSPKGNIDINTSFRSDVRNTTILKGYESNGWVNGEIFAQRLVQTIPKPVLGELIIYNHAISESTFTITPPSTTGDGVFTYSIVSGDSYASVNENTGVVQMLGIGTVTIRATQSRTINFDSFYKETSFIIDTVVIKRNTIFQPWSISNVNITTSTFNITPPFSNSDGVFTYSIVSGDSYASVNENTGVVTILAAGNVTVRVTQLENDHYNSNYTEASFTVTINNGTTISTNNNSTNTLNYYVLDGINKTVSCIGGTISNGNLVIPSIITYKNSTFTVIEIGDNAFYGTVTGFFDPNSRYPQGDATTISSITFPNTLITIGNNAFRNQYSINGEIIFPASLQYIGANVFGREINCVSNGYFNPSITSTKLLGNKPSPKGNIDIGSAFRNDDKNKTILKGYATKGWVNGETFAGISVQTIPFASISQFSIPNKNLSIDESTFTFNALTSNNTEPIIYSIISGNSIINLDENNRLVTMLSDGTVTIRALQNLTIDFDTTYIDATFTIIKGTPTINELNIPNKTYGDVAFYGSTSSTNSPGALSYSIISGGTYASINSNSGLINILNAGQVTIRATISETPQYYGGYIEKTFTINKLLPTLGELNIPSSKKLGEKPISIIKPSTNSSAGIIYSSSNLSVAKISNNNKILIVGSGTAIITAFQSSNNNYLSNYVTTTITVSQPTLSNPLIAESLDSVSYAVKAGSQVIQLSTNVNLKYKVSSKTFTQKQIDLLRSFIF